MNKIYPIHAFTDNFIWCVENAHKQCFVVDPGDATPVLKHLNEHGLSLEGILATHHHPDHVGGVPELLKNKTIPVYGPKAIDCVTHPVKDGETFTIDTLGLDFTVMHIPAHTLEHIAYYSNTNEPILFCGDTLFAGGCGRVFEGTFEQMYQSLNKLAQLPDETKIYCGHEYTEANLKFAAHIEPNSADIKQRIEKVAAIRSQNEPSLPCTLAEERVTNPFLRCDQPAVIQAAKQYANNDSLHTPEEIFAEIRKCKDNY